MQGPLSSLQTLTALYSLPASDFHVIGGGYNTQTALGTPNGGSLSTTWSPTTRAK